jgi:hypothetical protein
VLVTVTAETAKMPRCDNSEFAGMNFLYGFCDAHSLAALREYQHQYLDWRSCYQHVFKMVHHNLGETSTLMWHALVGHGRCSVLHKIVNIPQFLCHVLWTVEAVYIGSDVHNLHSLHVWAAENPHAADHSSFKQRFIVNIWAGVIGDYVM